MRRSAGRVFCGIIKHFKILFAKFLVCLKKPVNIKGTVTQFLRRERRVLRNNRRHFVVKSLAGVRYKIVTGTRETGHFEILLNHRKPLLRVHGKFHKAFLRDVRSLQCLLQILRSLLRFRHGNLQQVAEHMTSVLAGRIIAVSALQWILSKRRQNLYHIVNAINDTNAADVF